MAGQSFAEFFRGLAGIAFEEAAEAGLVREMEPVADFLEGEVGLLHYELGLVDDASVYPDAG